MEYLPPLFRIVLIWRKQATEVSSAEIWTLFRTKVEFTLLPTFSLHCSVWVKWLFKRYSRHFSTHIGVQKHGKSFALIFINIWQLLYLDLSLVSDRYNGHSAGSFKYPWPHKLPTASYFCPPAIAHQLPTESGSRGASFMPISALLISICWLCRVLFVLET